MAIFLVSFVVILASCAALALGQWFGRAPIKGGCRPETRECCRNPDACDGNLATRSLHKATRSA